VTTPHDLFRVIDANFNRASEGLRVVEDLLRLVRNDVVLSARTKSLRHALADVLSQAGGAEFLRTRDIENDVGRTIQTEQEYSRESIDQLLAANLKRSEQSLRVIEECLKTISRHQSERCETIRYEVYQLELAVDASGRGRLEFGAARLGVLVDGQNSPERFEQLCMAIIEAGADWIQLRDKHLTDRELLERGAILSRLTRRLGARWIMNDRADLALIARADGLHIGQDDLSLAEARRIVGPNCCIGVSTHSVEQAEAAIFGGANYLGVGPVFPSKTKQFVQVQGLELVSQIASRITLPWFALGGIGLENLASVLAAGATRIAVSQAVVGAADPGLVVRELQRMVSQAAKASAGSAL
jgi:thiamine-phosphate pyrophosphorylase